MRESRGRYFAARRRCIRRRRHNFSPKRLHQHLAIGLLLRRDLDHVHSQVHLVKCAGHSKRRSPLPCARLRRQRGQALFLCIIHLRGGRIKLMGTGGVGTLKLVINFSGRAQLPFQIIGAGQGRRAVHPVKIEDSGWNVYKRIRLVQFLIDKRVAEYRRQIRFDAGLQRSRMKHGIGLLRHKSAQIHPLLRHLVFS